MRHTGRKPWQERGSREISSLSPRDQSSQRLRCAGSAVTPGASVMSKTASAVPAIRVRVLPPGYRDGLRRKFSRLSRETLYRRSCAPYPRVPEWVLDSLLGIECYNGESVVAVARDKIVGHAMYVPSPDGSEVEVAVVVEDSWQSKGVGKLLLSKLSEKARQWSIETFTGTVLAENHRALDFFLAASSEVHCKLKDGSYLLRAPLSGDLDQHAASLEGVSERQLQLGSRSSQFRRR
jgi:GNAT superfamily N-acetyltransferase